MEAETSSSTSIGVPSTQTDPSRCISLGVPSSKSCCFCCFQMLDTTEPKSPNRPAMSDPRPPEPPHNGGAAAAAAETLAPVPTSKRQRRPSVRLGEIGGQPAAIPHDPFIRRHRPWKPHPSDPRPRQIHPAATKPHWKSRRETLDGRSPPSPDAALIDEEAGPVAASGINRVPNRVRRGGATARRPRTNWGPRVEEGTELRSSAGEDAGDEGYVEDSDSQSGRDDTRPAARVRVSDADAMEEDVPSETDNRDWSNRNGVGGGGVRVWLNQLGMGRYATLFEVHEVNDEVLPLLTLEDLKDMGINAVGSRRKMFSEIQKLRKNAA